MCTPSEHDDQCQAKLDIMVEAFICDDWATYCDAAAWLRDFTQSEKYRTRPRGQQLANELIE